MRIKTSLIFSLLFIWQIHAYSEEIHLKNGDRLSGEIIEQNDANIFLKTDAIGTILIKRNHIDYIGSAEKEILAQTDEMLWQREASLGYNQSSGNTQNNQFSLTFSANRKTDYDEFIIKADTFYSSSNEKMDAQKWYGMARYAFSFLRNKWYNFYKIEADHDRFADINYRVIPVRGVGYWLFDNPDLKAMAEVGLGLEYTNFRSTAKNSSEIILAPRVFLEKKFFDSLKVSQDIIMYPYLGEIGEYRLRSETSLVNPINDKLSLKLSLIVDYNSAPSGNTKNSDMRLISGLTYAF